MGVQLPLWDETHNLDTEPEREFVLSNGTRGVTKNGRQYISVLDIYRIARPGSKPSSEWKRDQKSLIDQGVDVYHLVDENRVSALIPYTFTASKSKRPTPCIDAFGMARLSMVAPYPELEQMRQEMANLYAKSKQRAQIPETQSKPFLRALHNGYSHDEAHQWVDIRESQRKTYPILTSEWQRRGAKSGRDYARLNNALSEAVLGETAAQWKQRTGIKDTPRNHLSGVLNLAIELTQQFALRFHRDRNTQGISNLERDIFDAGDIFDHAELREIASEQPLQLPPPKPKQKELGDGQ